MPHGQQLAAPTATTTLSQSRNRAHICIVYRKWIHITFDCIFAYVYVYVCVCAVLICPFSLCSLHLAVVWWVKMIRMRQNDQICNQNAARPPNGMQISEHTHTYISARIQMYTYIRVYREIHREMWRAWNRHLPTNWIDFAVISALFHLHVYFYPPFVVFLFAVATDLLYLLLCCCFYCCCCCCYEQQRHVDVELHRRNWLIHHRRVTSLLCLRFKQNLIKT